MALLSRITQKIFGTSGSTSEFGQIGSKAAGAPQTTKDLDLIQALSQYLDGLEAIVSDQGTSVLPYFEDMNSLFFLTTSQLAYLFQAGVPEWDDATEYYQGVSLVLYDGDIWIDTFGTPGTPNLNNVPPTNLDKWRSITTDASLVDSGAANAYVLTSQAGTVSSNYYDGMKITFKAANENTGASTVDVNGIGAKSITRPDGSGITGGQIPADDYSQIIYNLASDRFELVITEPDPVDLYLPGKTLNGIRQFNNGADYFFDDWDGTEILTNSGAGEAKPIPYKNSLSNVFTGFEVLGYEGDKTDKIIDFLAGFNWVKCRDSAQANILHDIQRNQKNWQSNSTAAQGAAGTVDSSRRYFQRIGNNYRWTFSIGGSDTLNELDSSFITWNWHYPLAKAWHANGGTSRKVPTPWGIVDSVESNASSGLTGDQVVLELYNPLTGNGCLLYIGTGANRTLDISGGITPEMMIVKQMDVVQNAAVYHSQLNGGTTPENYAMTLASTGAEAVAALVWNNTAPTTTTIDLGTSSNCNTSGGLYILYYFAPKAGLQAFGEYAGNDSTNNQATGCKDGMFGSKTRTGAANWSIFDKVRDGSLALYWNLTNTEVVVSTLAFGATSGVEISGTAANLNASGNNYVYWHFGKEMVPQGNADVYPTNALTSSGQNNTVKITFEIKTGLVINTELKAYASREAVPNWVLGSLTKIADLSDGYEQWEAEIDISGNAAGTSMRWRILQNEAGPTFQQFDIENLRIEWS